LKCPLGVPDRSADRMPPYPFSYTVNMLFTGLTATNRPFPWITPPCKLGKAVGASRKILAVEEDTSSISDGSWYSTTGKFWLGGKIPFVSVRHNRDGREYSDRETALQDHGRGNVVFADGHGDFIDRRLAIAPFYCIPDYDGPPPSF